MVKFDMKEHTFVHLMEAVSEGHAKMELIQDYMKRFQIRDTRITSPFIDISRVLSMIQSIVENDTPGENEIAEV